MSIIAQIKKGDQEIYKTAKAILKDEDDVCDAIQDTALSIYKNIKNLKNEKYFKTWVIKITINKCYDIITKNRLNSEKIEKVKFYDEEVHNNFDKNIIIKTDLETALNSLDEDLRVTTVLYYYNDLSVAEISEVLDIPKGTVKSRVFRAREKLYEILSKEEVNANEQEGHIY